MFWRWIIFALYHGWVCFFIPLLGLKDVQDESGVSSDHWYMACVSFTLCVHVVTYKLFLESYYWNVINSMTGLLSISMYYLIVIMFSMDQFAIGY